MSGTASWSGSSALFPHDQSSEASAHLVQFYEGEAFLVDTITRFVEAGLVSGDGVVVIATRSHQDHVRERLEANGVDVAAATVEGRYFPLDAAETLARFMTNGAPDRSRFAEAIGGILLQAARRHRRIRAFGEMVAVLWAQGKREAALQIEDLWTDLARSTPLTLLCAYPLHAFQEADAGETLMRICTKHSAVVPAESYPSLAQPAERARAILQLQQKASAHDGQQVERNRLAALVDSSDDAIIGKTLDGIVESWNDSARRLFGWTAEEMVGQPISRIIPDERTDELERILTAIRRGERVHHYETKRLRKDGRRIHVSLSVSPIKDAAGRIVGASKIARDITERKRHEEEIREQRAIVDTLYRLGLTLSAELDLEKLLRAVTDAATVLTGAEFGVFLYNDAEDGQDVVWSSAAGPSEDAKEFAGAEIAAFVATTLSGESLVRLDDVTEDPRYQHPSDGDAAGAGPKAPSRVRSYLAAPIIRRGDQILGGLFLGHSRPGVFTEQSERVLSGIAAQAAVAVDNARLYETERRLRKAAEEANRTKDEFLAMLGHELRNPLASVRNAVVSAALDPSRRERALGIARRGVDQLARLVDDLLDVARIAQGKISLRRDRIRMAAIIERAVETVRELVEERAHRLVVSVPPEPIEIEGDQTRLEQVLVNLVTNAAKYTERGGRIEVSAERRGDEVLLRVRDDGVGISADVLPRIFELFTQAERGLHRSPGGLGIGLTVVKRIVGLHGGRVEARSDGPGKGAEFVVSLPAAPVVAEAPPPAGALTRESYEKRRVRILLVEDNPDIAEGMMMLLELLGHQVQVAHDGMTALEVARSFRPELMLVDIGLPGIDGYEVARLVRADAQLAGLVLVALTGYSRDEDKQRAAAAGFDHHLTKPVELDELSALVAALPRSRGAPEPLAS